MSMTHTPRGTVALTLALSVSATQPQSPPSRPPAPLSCSLHPIPANLTPTPLPRLLAALVAYSGEAAGVVGDAGGCALLAGVMQRGDEAARAAAAAAVGYVMKRGGSGP